VNRRTLLRLLVVVALVAGMHGARAQCAEFGCQQQPASPNSASDEIPLGLIIKIVEAIVGLGIVQMISPDAPPPSATPPGRRSASPPGGGSTNVQALRPGCNLPPVGETRFVPNEVIVDASVLSVQTLNTIAANLNMTPIEDTTIALTGRRLYRWRIDGGGSVPDMIRAVCNSDRFLGAQPNYLYALAQAEQEQANSEQYAPEKLKLPEAHLLSKGDRVLVAVIDSEVDVSHPDLAGAIIANFDASPDDEQPHSHGTGMAGAIAARHTMLGVAPRVGLLAIRAFSSHANSAEGTTLNVLKGLDWAAAQGARIVNMSFAGPSDPRLRDSLAKANKKGIVLIAAAGNAGPKSPPLYPGADPNVIAVSATDSNDELFVGSNRGKYIAVAAPGVEIFALAPDGTYQLTTGTSVAAAEVSGVAALLIERNPALTPEEVRRILIRTAKPLGPKGGGYRLVDALAAVTAAKPK
jgi:subtilisin family serine protease